MGLGSAYILDLRLRVDIIAEEWAACIYYPDLTESLCLGMSSIVRRG